MTVEAAGGGGAVGPPFPHYAASPDSIGSTADDLVSNASSFSSLVTDIQQAHGSAQDGVDADLSAPMASAPQSAIANATRLGGGAVFAGSAVRLFSDAVSDFNRGIDLLNLEWSAADVASGAADHGVLGVVGKLASPLLDDAKEALASHLRSRYAALESDLDASANEVAGMLARGPNDDDWKRLGEAGVLPTASPDLGRLGLPLPTETSPVSAFSGLDLSGVAYTMPRLPSLDDIGNGIKTGADWVFDAGRAGLNAVNGNTALGLGIGLGFGGDAKYLDNGTLLVTGYDGPNSGRTMTIGNVIIQGQYDDVANDPDLKAHEQRHSTQWAAMGPAFIPYYYGQSLKSWVLTGDAAAMNNLEVGADLDDGGYQHKPVRIPLPGDDIKLPPWVYVP